jgi:hypothetical protein
LLWVEGNKGHAVRIIVSVSLGAEGAGNGQFATISSTSESKAGKLRPRRKALVIIPAHAAAVKKYLSATLGSSTAARITRGNDKDSPSSLGRSKKLGVEHSPGQAIPDVGKRPDHSSKVLSAIDSNRVWDILEERPRRPELPDDVDRPEEEPGVFPVDTLLLTGNGEVRTGRAEGDDIGSSESENSIIVDIGNYLQSGALDPDDSLRILVPLDGPNGREAVALHPLREAENARE